MVQELREALVRNGHSVFLDSGELHPGRVWRRDLEAALQTSRSIAICVGSAGPGPWTELEIDSALRRNREDPSFQVVPVLLQGGDLSRLENISELLRSFQMADLTEGFEGVEFADLSRLITRVAKGAEGDQRATRQLPIGDVQQGLKRLQDRFFSSLRPLLAGGQQIPREETQEVGRHLESSEVRIVVVHGVAGCGKSGVLLELADKLSEEGRPFLPLRLDRHSLKGTPTRFATTELLLPGSPGRCLTNLGTHESRTFLLLDQLDALRWTGAHSSEAWDVCREMILEVLAASPTTKVVVCCRTFDLQHDPQLRSWKEQSQGLREVRVGDLNDEQVRAAVDRVASSKGPARKVAERELKLLRRIHHLQMWLTLYPCFGAEGSLGTRRALMEAFWQDRRAELEKAGIARDRIERFEVRLVEEMHEGARLTAPVGALNLSRKEAEAYQSLHILQVDRARNRVSFCHQSYLDYLVALRIVGNLAEGKKSLLTWLGSKERQTLFRREQLRLVLEELRDRDAGTYLVGLQALLSAGEEIRFHLRLLCLQFLSQLSEPSLAEGELVKCLLEQPYWHEHVLGDVVRGQAPWFDVLDDAGIFERWLASDEDPRLNSALGILSLVCEARGDRVARLLRPYLNRSAEWNHRLALVLRFDPATDSDALFDIRIELARRGSYTAQHLAWHELAHGHPERFVQLVCQLFLPIAQELIESEVRLGLGSRLEVDWHYFEYIKPALLPDDLRQVAWDMLCRSVAIVAQIRRYKGEVGYSLETYDVDFKLLRPVLGFLRVLGKLLLNENWVSFCASGDEIAGRSRWREIIFLDSLKEGPANTVFADWALGWLMAEPWRARLRMKIEDSEWLLSGRLLERCAPVCSEETFRRLEIWVLGYREPDLKRWLHRRHECLQHRENLRIPSGYGRTPHALLHKLPVGRMSVAGLKCCAELNRKFGVPASEEAAVEARVEAGYVASPLGWEVLCKMSNRSLLSLASSRKIGDRSRSEWGRQRRGRFEVASLETIAADFRLATQREPERFGRLVSRWPVDGHPHLLEAILQGLESSEERRQKPDSEPWTPPCHDLLEEVVASTVVQALAHSEADLAVAKAVCGIVRRYPEYPWSSDALEFVVWAAGKHRDPAGGFYPIGLVAHDSDDISHLGLNALNVTRGGAAYTIASLLFHHPEFFFKVRPGIECLVRDGHPAVRVAACEACRAVLNIDRDQAVSLFLEACKGGDALLATREAEEFLRYSWRTHLAELLPILDRMVASQLDQVSTIGAKWVAAAFLLSGEIEERFKLCIAGTPGQRKGVAQAAASLISEPNHAEASKRCLLLLAEDPAKEVALEVAKGFRGLSLGHIKEDPEAWQRFARSRAFQAAPSYLLKALTEQAGDLVPFAECLLAAGEAFASELSTEAKDPTGGRAAEVHTLLPLLLRLYEQAKDRDSVVYQHCLDLWDRLLEARVGTATGLTRDLDSM